MTHIIKVVHNLKRSNILRRPNIFKNKLEDFQALQA
jgi:hypothetical protein